MRLAIDSSVIVAIIGEEAGFEAYVAAMTAPGTQCYLSAAGYLETAIVLTFRRDDPMLVLDNLLNALGIEIVDLTANHARIARAAYHRFGKGSGHSAGLNFGDSAAYALARALDAPLLFKGDDFRHTDIVAAI